MDFITIIADVLVIIVRVLEAGAHSAVAVGSSLLAE